MNKTVKYSIITATFIGAIALAALGYNSLSKDYIPDTESSSVPSKINDYKSDIPSISEPSKGNDYKSDIQNSSVTTKIKEYTPSTPSASTPSASTPSSSAPAKIQAPPDFTVQNQKGETVRLKDKLGKPIVINFWATWCGPCRSEMPYFNDLYHEYKDSVTFMMVNLTDGQRDTVEKVNSFIKTNGYDFPVYYDTKSSAANAYNVSSIPMSIFINEKGEIVDRHTGTLSKTALNNYIKKIK